VEDTEIIKLYWERSQQALTETADKYGRQLHTLANRILYNHEDSEECVNDTYHAAWNTMPPQRPAYFFAYLAKITRNYCFDRLDYRKAAKRDEALVTLGEELDECIPTPNDCEQQIESEELSRIISKYLHTQPFEMRTVFVRRYWYMDSIAEISSGLHISESKVKSILFRMRNGLRKYLEKEEVVL